MVRKRPSLVCRFIQQDFQIEIFCQPVPVKQQLAYRHMIIEYWLLNTRGTLFKKKILDLRAGGLKTEPAFAEVIGLDGDPYDALLTFEEDDSFKKFIL